MKVYKILMKFFAAVILCIFVYFMISFGGANENVIKLYSSLSAERSVNEIAKKYTFVAKYTYATGDITFAQQAGFTKEQAEVMQTQGTVGDTGDGSSGSGGNSSFPSLGSYSDQDLRPLAQAVAASSLVDSVMATTKPNSGNSYYCTGCSPVWYADYNSNNISLQFRCCTTLVQGVERFLGNDAFLSVMLNSYQCADWISKTNGDSHRVDANGLTFGDLAVGDVLLRNGHTEIIVYKEGDTVYIGNMGNDEDIVETAQVGYGYTKNASASVGASWEYVLRY